MKFKLFVIFILFYNSVFAFDVTEWIALKQDTTAFVNSKSYLNFDLGYMDYNDIENHFLQTSGYAFKFDFNIINKNYRFLKISFMGSSEKWGIFGDNITVKTFQLNYMTGWQAKTKDFYGAFNFGIGYIGGVKKGKFLRTEGWLITSDYYEEDKFSTVGIPVELILGFHIGKRLNFNVFFHQNFNAHMFTSTYGISVRTTNPFNRNY